MARTRGRVLTRAAKTRRGMLLVVVLVIISVLALLAAGLMFEVNSDFAGVEAQANLQQARLACDSAIDRVAIVLRQWRTNMDEWYNKPEIFRRQLVWAPDQEGGSTSLADQEKVQGRPAWRFSVVAYKPGREGEVAKMRYGITDEASKLNLRSATRAQLLRLFEQFPTQHVTPQGLADALIDWQDKDDTPRSRTGAESNYYMKLEPRYRAKDRPLETVEELLMVRGFDGRLLYGEDYNRNGYLDENENDGPEGAFPPDDGDGILDQGLWPYVTVYSWDWDRSNDNKPRVSLNDKKAFSDPANLPEHIQKEVRPEIITFIAQAQQAGYTFKSVGELLGLQVHESGRSEYDKVWKAYAEALAKAEGTGTEAEVPGEETTAEQTKKSQDKGTGDGSQDQPDVDQSKTGKGQDTNKGKDKGADQQGQPKASDQRSGSDSGSPDGSSASDQTSDSGKKKAKKNDGRTRRAIRDGEEVAASDGTDSEQPPARRPWLRGKQSQNKADDQGASNQGDDKDKGPRDRGNDGGPRHGGDDKKPEDREEGDSRASQGTGSAPADESKDQEEEKPDTTPIIPNPVTAEDMAVLMDRFSASKDGAFVGQINVNTASRVVLRTIVGLSEENIEGIISRREQLAGPEKQTPAWLATTGALDPATFAVLTYKGQLTARSNQYSIDVIGFADHVGAMKRVEAVLEMRFLFAQLLYWRDISALGIGYPVWDDQRSEGFAFSDR